MKNWTTALVALALVLGFASLTAIAEEKEEKKLVTVNEVCPMSGEKVNAEKTSEYTFKFCCGNCVEKFEKNPLAHFNKAQKAKEGTCALSGKEANPEKTAKVNIAFCCGDCKANFDKEPAKFIAKVKAKAPKKDGE